jgi:gamma-glutamyl-gamma-aminobutyraldehyde dehydrogenase
VPDLLQSTDWISRARDIVPDGRALINGSRPDLLHSRSLTSPRDGRVLAAAEFGEADLSDAAVAGARSALRDTGWADARPAERGAVLRRWADLIHAHRDELALLLCLETGKPISSALQVDLVSVVRAIRWYADLSDRLQGEHPDVGPAALALVERRPVGVVAIIIPSNFPLSGIGYDVAPALMVGNAVVAKPSETAPLAVLRSAELAVAAGLPAGLLNVVPGDATAGRALGEHRQVDALVVTGSETAGRAYLSYSAGSNGKKVSFESGGKSSAVVGADADVPAAARALAWGAYFNQGHMCTCPSRIFVHAAVQEPFAEAFTEYIDSLVVGDPLDPATSSGAMHRPQADRFLEQIQEATAAGAVLARGGQLIEAVPGGCYVEPTLLVDVPDKCPALHSEIWGPVSAVCNFTTFEDAIEQAASPGYGIGLSLWTSSTRAALAAARASAVGTVWVNCFEADDLTVPAGGMKRSGYGRTKGLAALDRYTALQTIWIDLEAS